MNESFFALTVEHFGSLAVRINGWKVYRVASVADVGVLLGSYQGHREANKALEQIAYEAEPQW